MTIDDDDGARARRSDPHTSHAAAAGVSRKRLGEMQTLVLRAARWSGDRGVTCAEAVRIINERARKHGLREIVLQSICPRFIELINQGLIERRLDQHGKEFSRLGDLNAKQIINWITPAGVALLKVMGI